MAKCLRDTPNGKMRGRHACAFRERSTPSYRTTSLFCHFMMTCWQVQSGGALICAWSSLDKDNVRHQSPYYRVASSACSSDTPCDHWHITETQARALSGTRVLPRERYGYPTPDSLPRGTGRTTLTFGDLPSHVGSNYGYGYGCRCKKIRRCIPEAEIPVGAL